MAENPPNDVLTSQGSASASGPDPNASPNGHNDAVETRASRNVSTTGFQAVNAKAVSDNLSGSTAAAAQNGASGSGASANSTSAQLDGLDGTYGTRSRNRTGNTRINYAEDQGEEFEFSSAATTTTKKKASNEPAPAGQSAADSKRVSDLAKLLSNSNGGLTTTTHKESTPGSSGTPAVSSKKRKAAGAVPQHSQTPPAVVQTSAPAARKLTASASSTMARETNVMTFTKHRSSLNKRGELIADDGTKLSVNGKSFTPFLEVQALPRSDQLANAPNKSPF